MFVSDSLSVNEKHHLTIGGCDTVDLAEKYGTPLMVFSEDGIRRNCRKFVSSIEENYDGKGLALYASKAFSCLAMYRLCKEEKMGVDVVSGGELYTALKAGFPPEKIFFHGNNKTKLAAARSLRPKIHLRVKPGIDAHTHQFIRTGQIDSKFGFALETGEAMLAVKEAIADPNLELVGLHCHIGSQIFDIDPFEHAAEVMLTFMAQIKEETGVELSELNLGGGFGIKYTEQDNPEDFTAYMKRVAVVVKKQCAEKNLSVPFIVIEPGRSIIGAEGITLYTVGSVKEIPGIRTYVSIDGGMTDNPRYILYQSEYEILCPSKADLPKDAVVTVAGKCCESGDLIQENAPIQTVQAGDLLAVLSTGAYNYSMASNYNRVPRPLVLAVRSVTGRNILLSKEKVTKI